MLRNVLAQAFLPLLGTDLSLRGPPGKIINMSSIYASYTLPFQACQITALSLHLSYMVSKPVRLHASLHEGFIRTCPTLLGKAACRGL